MWRMGGRAGRLGSTSSLYLAAQSPSSPNPARAAVTAEATSSCVCGTTVRLYFAPLHAWTGELTAFGRSRASNCAAGRIPSL